MHAARWLTQRACDAACQVAGQQAARAQQAQQQAVVTKLDKVKNDQARRADALGKDAADAELKVRLLMPTMHAALLSDWNKTAVSGPYFICSSCFSIKKNIYGEESFLPTFLIALPTVGAAEHSRGCLKLPAGGRCTFC